MIARRRMDVAAYTLVLWALAEALVCCLLMVVTVSHVIHVSAAVVSTMFFSAATAMFGGLLLAVLARLQWVQIDDDKQ